MYRFRAIEEKITRELKQVKQDVAALRVEIKEMSATGQATSVIASKVDDCGTPTDVEELMYAIFSSHLDLINYIVLYLHRPSLQTQSEVLKNRRLLASMNVEQVCYSLQITSKFHS